MAYFCVSDGRDSDAGNDEQPKPGVCPAVSAGAASLSTGSEAVVLHADQPSAYDAN